MTTIPQIAKRLRVLLWRRADDLGRSTGFIQRQRKFSGSSFAQMLVCGALGEAELSYTDLQQYAALEGLEISAQGIEERFTPVACEFMQALLEAAVHEVVQSYLSVAIPIVERFAGVYIRDSSIINLPSSLQDQWSGVGNQNGATAALKLQVRLEYASGAVDGPALQAGRVADRRTPYTYTDEPRGSLSLSDLGYFSLVELQAREQAGQYVVLRYKCGTGLYTEDGQRLDLLAWLRQLKEPCAELPVLVGATERVPLRLLAEKVPPEVLEQRHRQLREYARKKQATLKAETLALAEWTLILTNVPAPELTLAEAKVLLYLRWQVELLFKLWKSVLKVDEWRSENPWRILCELYAKLIAVVLSHWLFQLEWAHYPDRSLFKAAQAIQKLAAPLILALHQRLDLCEILEQIRHCIQVSAHTNKRRKKPATFQSLLNCSASGGLT